MQSHRFLAGPLGLVLVCLIAFVHPGTARAAAAEHARALPQREITSHVEDLGNRLIFRGNVSPGHAHKRVVIQKRTCATDACTWYGWKTVRTGAKGGFKQRVTAPKKGSFYWRAKVKSYGGYATSYSQAWRTYLV